MVEVMIRARESIIDTQMFAQVSVCVCVGGLVFIFVGSHLQCGYQHLHLDQNA